MITKINITRFFLSVSVLLFMACNEESRETKQSEQIPGNSSPTIHTKYAIPTPDVGYAHLPRLTVANDSLYLLWMEENEGMALQRLARYDGSAWSNPQTVRMGTNWFINWADFPALAVNDRHTFLTRLVKSDSGTYDYDIRYDFIKGGEILVENKVLHTDGRAAEHGFVSAAPYQEGFTVSWLDGRDTKNKDASRNKMTLRNAFISAEGKVTQDLEVDARVCDCCSTDTAITENGPIIAYRDRSDTQPEYRDIAVIRWLDGAWTTPETIAQEQWQLEGCPVNGPAIATYGSNVAVSWFTAQGGIPRVLIAFSKNNGASFGNPIRLDLGDAVGRVDTILLEDGSAVASWLQPVKGAVSLMTCRVYQNGRHDPPIVITTTTAERQSGFPQMVLHDAHMYYAWTSLREGIPNIEMTKFPLSAFTR